MSTSPLSFDAFVINNVEGPRFLDVGCGMGKWGYLLKKYANPEGERVYVAGVDAFAPHVESLRREGIYDEVAVGDARALPFPDQSFDSAVACEVLEHLPAGDGPRLIAELRRVARKCFVVTTPTFPCLRGGGMTLDGFNEHEAHRHIYTYAEFRRLGFTQVIGLGRLRARSWKLSVALSGLGLFRPSWSRFLMGFWFADGRKRDLYSE
jgi:SAM-dependent methyltransferase